MINSQHAPERRFRKAERLQLSDLDESIVLFASCSVATGLSLV